MATQHVPLIRRGQKEESYLAIPRPQAMPATWQHRRDACKSAARSPRLQKKSEALEPARPRAADPKVGLSVSPIRLLGEHTSPVFPLDLATLQRHCAEGPEGGASAASQPIVS
jgi:hypothetical protein